MSGGCLECVKMVSGGCPEGVSIVSGGFQLDVHMAVVVSICI